MLAASARTAGYMATLVQEFVKAYRPVFDEAQKEKPIAEAQHRLIAAFLCSAEK